MNIQSASFTPSTPCVLCHVVLHNKGECPLLCCLQTATTKLQYRLEQKSSNLGPVRHDFMEAWNGVACWKFWLPGRGDHLVVTTPPGYRKIHGMWKIRTYVNMCVVHEAVFSLFPQHYANLFILHLNSRHVNPQWIWTIYSYWFFKVHQQTLPALLRIICTLMTRFLNNDTSYPTVLILYHL